MKRPNLPFSIVGMTIGVGERRDIQVKVAEMYTLSPVFVPVTVINGAHAGPSLFVTAAIHGDELNGIEVIRRVRSSIDPGEMSGTLILVAIANPLSFINLQRKLPDGRDLNRVFPGSPKGSIASQMAYVLFRKICRKAQYGIDLHTAAGGRTNLPHVRGDMTNPEVRRLARAFRTEVIFDLPGERKTLRSAACRKGIPTIVYEAGEPMKFQQPLIAKGFQGVVNVMRELGMTDGHTKRMNHQIVVKNHRWVRARNGGILAFDVQPGAIVPKGRVVAHIMRPFGTTVKKLRAPFTGLVVGVTTIPMVLPGSAICHILKLGKQNLRRAKRWKLTKWSAD